MQTCMICDIEFQFSSECFETDDGDMCPTCTTEMREEEKQEIQYQEEEKA